MKTCHGSKVRGVPMSGVPSSLSPWRWQNLPSMMESTAVGSEGSKVKSSRPRSDSYRLTALITSSPATIEPSSTPAQ